MRRCVVIAGVLGAFFMTKSALAAECTGMWDLLLSTDPDEPKGISGDGAAAYGVLSYRGDPNLSFKIYGEFPRARFMSLSTTVLRKEYPVDAILDRDIEPDAGSENPFFEGAPIDAARRAFTITAMPDKIPSNAPNVVKLPGNHLLQALMYRIFAPNNGATQVRPEEFPRVFAFDARTGNPRACPQKESIYPYFRFPQALGVIVKKKPRFTFKKMAVLWGPNPAIPAYLYAVNPVALGEELMVAKFKAPTFVDTRVDSGPFVSDGDVRYWSLCVQNYPRNETRGCLPDYQARLDEHGYVTVVVGSGEAVRAKALARGFNFLEDTREPRQFIVGFAYRNIMPSAAFLANGLYQGDYLPRGVLCRREEFLAGACDP